MDIYVQESDYSLSLHGDNIVIRNGDGHTVREVSLNQVDNLMIFGSPQLSTQLLKRLSLNGTNVYFFTSYGKFLSYVDSLREGDFEKQLAQAQATLSEDFSLVINRAIISTKIKQQLLLLKNYDNYGILTVDEIEKLEDFYLKSLEATSSEELMGYEGRMAKSYFYFLSLMVPDEFKFNGRNKRPAKDPFNSLLNFGYSILHSFFIGMIKKHGLSLGFATLHTARRHHATLASDLMEEWRAVIVDDTVMSLILEGEIDAADFEVSEDGGVYLTKEARQIYLKRLRLKFLEIHPYIADDNKRYSFIYMIDCQLQSLVRAYQERNADLYLNVYTGE